MTQFAHKPRFTRAEYMVIERTSAVRHELIDGELVAMAGGSREHSDIINALTVAIYGRIQPPCRLSAGNLKVFAGRDENGYYPDLMVCCDSRDKQPDRYTETNPRLVIEVLSPSTEAFDRGEKCVDYQTLPSLEEYVLVAQDQQRIDVYRRTGNAWTEHTYRVGESVTFDSIGLTVPLATIYRDVFPAHSEKQIGY